MESYEKLEEELKETKTYAKRVIDLWADAKKWKMLAKRLIMMKVIINI